MKISNSIRLTQKRNLLAYLHQFSLKINDLAFVEEIIYGEDSYELATTISNSIPLKPTFIFNTKNECRIHCNFFVKKLLSNNTSYYIVFDNMGICGDGKGRRIAKPDKPIFKVKNNNILDVYEIFLKDISTKNLLICSEDFTYGIYTNYYADHPTEENNWYDGDLYECYKWGSII